MEFKTIAVDFDGCLHSGRWPEIGQVNRQAVDELIRRRENGDKVILWTCRQGNLLQEAVHWCKERGLEFDSVNANLPEYIKMYGNDCRKVYADEYWDDKSVPVVAGQTKVKQGPEGWIVVINDPPKKKPALIRLLQWFLGKEGDRYVRDVVRGK